MRIEIPDEISNSAERFINASGYASVSDCSRSLLRNWTDDQEKKTKQPDQTKSDILRENTLRHLFPQWMTNFRDNLPVSLKSKDLYEVENIEKIKNAKSAIVIGAGPSLKKYNHLKMLAESGYKGLVIASDRIISDCLDAGLVPDIVVSIDGDLEIVDYYKNPLIMQNADKIQTMFSTTVNPKVVENWPCKDTLHFMNCHMDTMDSLISVSRAMWLMANKTVIQCLTKDTKVLVNGGYKDMGWMKSGDIVYSYNFEKRTIEKRRCIGVYSNGKRSILTVKTKTSSITSTPNHLFARFKNGKYAWVRADNLRKGDIVLTTDKWPKVKMRHEKIHSIEDAGEQEVFDIQIEGTHNFFANSILTHNTGGNVGMTGWFIAHALKKNPLCMIGIEFSHPCPVEVNEIESYQTYYAMHAGDMEKVMKCFRRDFNPFFKNEAITHYIWDTYFEVARSWMEALYVQHKIMTYSCTGGGLMHSFSGIECMHFQDFLQQNKI